MTLRERKKERTRDSIIKAATELFDQHGFDGTTIEAIAAAADVSRRTFFRYFATKEMVMFPHQSIYQTQFRELLLDGDPNETPMAMVRRACLEMARAYMASREDHLRQQRIIQRSRTLIARGNELDTDWEDTIAEALIVRMGGGHLAETRARYIAGAAMGIIRVTLQQWYASDCRSDLVEMGQEAMDLLANGVNSYLANSATMSPAAAKRVSAK